MNKHMYLLICLIMMVSLTKAEVFIASYGSELGPQGAGRPFIEDPSLIGGWQVRLFPDHEGTERVACTQGIPAYPTLTGHVTIDYHVLHHEAGTFGYLWSPTGSACEWQPSYGCTRADVYMNDSGGGPAGVELYFPTNTGAFAFSVQATSIEPCTITMVLPDGQTVSDEYDGPGDVCCFAAWTDGSESLTSLRFYRGDANADELIFGELYGAINDSKAASTNNAGDVVNHKTQADSQIDDTVNDITTITNPPVMDEQPNDGTVANNPTANLQDMLRSIITSLTSDMKDAAAYCNRACVSLRTQGM